MFLDKIKKGFTLTEVVIVMLVIAVVVSISIKGTKNKLSKITSYTYYAAYTTLNTVAETIIDEYKLNAKDYYSINTCNDGESCTGDNNIRVKIDDSECECKTIVRSLPTSNKNFCKLFYNYTNTLSAGCNGATITDSETDFSSKKFDISLNNGMKIYNLSQDPKFLDELKPSDYTDITNITDITEDTDINVLKKFYKIYGYKVYVDINGKNGDSTLWEDVFPFYITLSGQVIPLYHKESNNLLGGSNPHFLQVSVRHENGTWKRKSVSYQEAACIAKAVDSTSTYCKPDNGAEFEANTDDCNFATSCWLKYIKP